MALTTEKLKEFYSQAKKSKILFWAEQEFGWSPIEEKLELVKPGQTPRKAWYQPILLACFDGVFYYPEDYFDEDYAGKPIRKYAWRIGRQSGKCISEGTIIHTRDGKLVPIEEHPDSWVTKEQGEIWNVELKNGYSLRTTEEHKISVRRDGIQQWTLMKDIQIGDEIECLESWDKWGNGEVHYNYENIVASGHRRSELLLSASGNVISNGKNKAFRRDKNSTFENWSKKEIISGVYKVNNNLAELLGWLVADGNFKIGKKGSINFRNTNINYINRVKELVEIEFPDININLKKYPGNLHKKENYFLNFYAKEGIGQSKGKNSLKEFLKTMNYHPCGFPRAVAEYFTKEQVCAFMRGIWGGDGNFYFGKRYADINTFEATLACSLNRTYAEYCSALLTKLGIPNKITSQFGKKTTAPFYCCKFKNKYSMNKFRDVVGQVLDKTIPEKLGKNNLSSKYNFEIHHRAEDGEKLIWSKVWRKTKEEKLVRCYDVTYPGKGWFVCGSTVVSNSECLSIGALYLAIHKPVKFPKKRRYKDHSLIGPDNPTGWTETTDWYNRGAKIIVASADADKAKTVFDRVMKFINASKTLNLAAESGIIDVKLHPFPQIIFNLEGWTEPAEITFRGPGAKGQALRSKTFDYKLYDEVDYMPEAFFEAEKATEINAGQDGLVILSSTPSGKRGHFFKACFPSGTPVLMSDKTYKAIDDIQIGDMVYNRFGVIEPVIDIMTRTHDGKFVKFKTTLNNNEIIATSNHRVMSVRKTKKTYCKWCQKFVTNKRTNCIYNGNHNDYDKLEPQYNKLSELKDGDLIAMPKNIFDNTKNINCGLVFKNFVYVPISSIETFQDTKLVHNLTVGKDHSYIVNGYGVENCTNPILNFQEFHFPSWENPNYTSAMDRDFQEQHSPIVYEHEIMADWGTVEMGVFDWNYFARVFSYEYKPAEKRPGGLVIPGEFVGLSLNLGKVKQIGHHNLGLWLTRRLPLIRPMANYYFGADLGYQADAAEFVVFEEYNGVMKMILRLNMMHLTYDIQADIIAILDNHYKFASLGMDITGVGIAVAHFLAPTNGEYNKYSSHNFAQRLHGVVFNQKVTIGMKNGKKETWNAKELMTNMIVGQAQEKLLYMPGVNIEGGEEIENQFRNHTYSIGGNGAIIYSKSSVYPDHIVDSVRTVFYGKFQRNQPKNKNWSVGSAFSSRGSGGWR
jgi:hypothetical protein